MYLSPPVILSTVNDATWKMLSCSWYGCTLRSSEYWKKHFGKTNLRRNSSVHRLSHFFRSLLNIISHVSHFSRISGLSYNCARCKRKNERHTYNDIYIIHNDIELNSKCYRESNLWIVFWDSSNINDEIE